MGLGLVLGLLFPLLPAAVAAQEPEPVAISDAFEISGDAGGVEPRFTWTVTGSAPRWLVEATGPDDARLTFHLLDADGQEFERSSGDGQAAIRDVRLEPGTYTIWVNRTNDETFPFTLEARPEDAIYDPEPNDRPTEAVSIASGETATGRLARIADDVDVYALTVPSGPTELRDVRLVWDSETSRQLCLLGPDEARLQCRQGSGPLVLPNLGLEAGTYYLDVRGTVDPAVAYRLSVSAPRPRAVDDEAEPNDDFRAASTFEADLGAVGTAAAGDLDYLVVDVPEPAQLWSVEVTSEGGVNSLEWIQGGEPVAVSHPYCKATSAVIDDLYLVPGRQRFMVRTCADEPGRFDDYELTMTPRGQRDPDAEREPNSDAERAEPYAIGQRRVGRLTSGDDVDDLRFTLAAPSLIQLTLDQPEDGAVGARIFSGGQQLVDLRPTDPAEPFDVPLWLAPGDYLLELRPITPGAGAWALMTERLDPSVVPPDAEPNDEPGTARAAPATLTWTGTQMDADRDTDAVWLPPLDLPGPITITITGERPDARLFAGEDRVRVELEGGDTEGTFTAADPPVGEPFYLELWSGGAYEVTVGAPGWTPTTEPAPLALLGDVSLERDVVAAYWTEGQVVPGQVDLANDGDTDLELDLTATASHYAWHPGLATTMVDLAPGQSVEIPLSLEIEPDAWAGEPVEVRVTATSAHGGAYSMTAALTAEPDAEAVGSHQAWTVPEALLGGLNVAGAALGGVPAGTSPRPEREAFLFDDLTPPNGGYLSDGVPIEITVDLAGNEPVPVAGTILNPFAHRLDRNFMVRDFELLLSDDGSTWRSVLEAELQPLPVDQSFVLDDPVPATAARLRILSTWDPRGDGGAAALGEWKVVAEPGAVPDVMPADIADPTRGGYIARELPAVGSWDREYHMLDDDLHRYTVSVPREGLDPGRVELVIGFQEGRAAQITGLGWTDPEGTVLDERLDAVRVEVGLDGPLGPWTPLGTWDLARSEDGSVAPFSLPHPTWARYVRLVTEVDPGVTRSLESPGRIDVFERPPDETYRSILGEWGYTSDRGPFEWSLASATAQAVAGPDAGDTMGAALPLDSGEVHTDTAEVLEDVDWYRFDLPPEANTLTLDLRGVPSVGVQLELLDAAGEEVATKFASLPGGARRYTADVTGGERYFARVQQPPFSLLFTFDTSGSMGPYLDFVYEGMREFAADVRPGRELVKILPFDEDPLLETWSDQPVALEDAVNDYRPIRESSDMLSGLLVSSKMLADREGTRAILVVGDGETSTGLAPDLWAEMDAVQPTVFAVHVGADSSPDETRNMIRAWTDANGGSYSFPTTHAEMDRAFERMSARLRRPSQYTLSPTAELIDRRPGPLTVSAPEGAALDLAPNTGIEIVFDTSSSMRKKLGQKTRIAIAKSSLRELFGKTLPQGTPVAIRILAPGGRANACRSRLDVPLTPLQRKSALRWVQQVSVPRKAGTPIAEALEQVPRDLGSVDNRIIVLITDGEESCGGDPAAVAAELESAGFPVVLNIVGFALGDTGIKAEMASWAEATGGRYLDATDAPQLRRAIKAATGVPFDVFVGGVDEPVASGTVGGEPVELAPGRYRLEVRTDPAVTIDDVEVLPAEGADVVVPLEEIAGP